MMKVLHLPYNPAGQMSSQALALRDAGIDASFCTYGRSVFRYPTDIRSPLLHIPVSERNEAMMKFAREALGIYDIFHFQGGLTFSNSYGYEDLPMFEGRKKVMNFWGSEVRRLSMALRNNPYARAKYTDEDSIEGRLKHLSQYFDTVIVPDYEIHEYVKPYFPTVHKVNYVVDHRSIKPVYPNVLAKKPLVIHAPSEPYLKGTEFIVAAADRLKKSAKFDFMLIQNMSHKEAMDWYPFADIIVDQVCMGVYSIFAIESMLLGKPVITYIREDLREHYPPDLPIVSASPDTIEHVLEELINDPERRLELGKQGREYAIKHHSPQRIASQIIPIYHSLA